MKPSKIKRIKLKAKPVVATWLDMFTQKDYMSLLVPYLHAHDVIQMSRCCKQLYAFLYGPKVKKALCEVVERDLGAVYDISPLPRLGKSRNLHPVMYKDGIKYKAKQCGVCSHQLFKSDGFWDIDHPKRALCKDCRNPIRHEIYDEIQRVVLDACRKRYASSSMPRVVRIINRHRYTRPLELYPYSFDSQIVKDAKKANMMRNEVIFIMREVRLLDLVPLLVLKIDGKTVEANREKREIETCDEEDVERKRPKSLNVE